MHVDLNCDLGESFGPWPMGADEAMLELVSSANVACGFHAGDQDTMLKTARLARARNVAIGAHPGFDDLQGFGRRRVVGLSASEIETLIAYQIGALQAVAALAGHEVTHVKAHGALSNMACEEEAMATAIARAIKSVDPKLVFVVLPLSELEKAGEKAGLPMAREVFADRSYMDDGMLAPRSMKGSVLHDAAMVAERTWRMVADKGVVSLSGRFIPMRVDTICIHGDNAAAVALGQAVRSRLEAEGVAIEPFHRHLA
ncbi:MAG: LamB/YcsF family protein [Beijerinckiaceae bacterium]|nr:LamB/YcsF family protein [Beijerinckiaceae bacterium]